MVIQHFYCVSILLAFLYLANRKYAYYTLVLAMSIVVYSLVSTGLDYDFYQLDYETGYFLGGWPFFYTQGNLTAEPFYKIYSGFIRAVTGAGFNSYLVINFLLCTALSYYFSPFKSGRSKEVYYLFWLFMLPVITPTIFYFSPRSSISFFLVLSGFYMLIKMKRLLALFFFLSGISAHSQFVPIVVFLLLISFSLDNSGQVNNRNSYLYLLLYCVLLVLFLFLVPYIISSLSVVLSFLPSAEVAVNKLHYFNSAKSGFRITSILSLLVFPILMIWLMRNQKKLSIKYQISLDKMERLVFYLAVCVAFGFSVNLVYFNVPHLSGRLGRFSDYLSMGLLLPMALLCQFSPRLVVIVGFLFVIVAPFVYPTIYSVH